MLKRLGEGWFQLGLLVLILIGIVFSAQAYFLYDIGRLEAYNNAYEDAYRESAAHNKYDATERECRSSATSSKAVDCVKQAEKAERERHNSEQDLNAQRKMADWAWWMMIAAVLTAVLTTLGVVLIGLTLGYTRQAAEHTEGMLKEAKETTRTARKANQILVAEQRGWLKFNPSIGKVNFHDNKVSICINCFPENIGGKPIFGISQAYKFVDLVNVKPDAQREIFKEVLNEATEGVQMVDFLFPNEKGGCLVPELNFSSDAKYEQVWLIYAYSYSTEIGGQRKFTATTTDIFVRPAKSAKSFDGFDNPSQIDVTIGRHPLGLIT